MSHAASQDAGHTDRLPVPAAWQAAVLGAIQTLCDHLGVTTRDVAVARVDEVAGTGGIEVSLVSGGRAWTLWVGDDNSAPTLVE